MQLYMGKTGAYILLADRFFPFVTASDIITVPISKAGKVIYKHLSTGQFIIGNLGIE